MEDVKLGEGALHLDALDFGRHLVQNLAAELDEAECYACAVVVISGDLAQAIDALGHSGAVSASVGNIEGGVGAAAVEKAVRAAADVIVVGADHLT